MQKILIIQTSFIGDVVLSTSLVEKLGHYFPEAAIDMVVRKGNERLLENNPLLNQVLIWDKKNEKIRNLLRILKMIRAERYDVVVNLHRFLTTGFLTAFSNAKQTIGFDKNPLSMFFTKKVKHEIDATGDFVHEIDRNNQLIQDFTDSKIFKPRLYPSEADFEVVEKYRAGKFVTMSPSSVWFTKQFPFEKWVELMAEFPREYNIILLGGPDNAAECDALCQASAGKPVVNLAGKLSFLQSAALMKSAEMNYVNDSAPLHFASAMNAPVTAIFCSTVPAFGFTPLSDKSFLIETDEKLKCRPCGLHGKRECPQKHFDCGRRISVDKILETINLTTNN